MGQVFCSGGACDQTVLCVPYGRAMAVVFACCKAVYVRPCGGHGVHVHICICLLSRLLLCRLLARRVYSLVAWLLFVYSLVAWLLFVSPIGKAGIQPSGMAVVCVAYWQGGYTA